MNHTAAPSWSAISLRLLTSGILGVAAVALLAIFRETSLLVPAATVIAVTATHLMSARLRPRSQTNGRFAQIGRAVIEEHPALAPWVGPGTPGLMILQGLTYGLFAAVSISLISVPLGFALGAGAGGFAATLAVMTALYAWEGRRSLTSDSTPGPIISAIAHGFPTVRRVLMARQTMPVLVGRSALRAVLIQVLRAALTWVAAQLTSPWWIVLAVALALLVVGIPEIVGSWLGRLKATPTDTHEAREVHR